MPNKETYFIFFIVISSLLVLMQMFVYFWLRRILRRDFPVRSKKWLPRIKWTFIVLNIPIALIFFWRQINLPMTTVSKLVFYPFTVWEAIIIVWTVILIPITLFVFLRWTVRNSVALFSVKKKI
ncbi:MAG TPA: hypothetical protein VFO76_02385 [Candidatus Kapabacteria bacterium]|nr:hypothetical protein [Candidatus Kapabacteria bacterium]